MRDCKHPHSLAPQDSLSSRLWSEHRNFGSPKRLPKSTRRSIARKAAEARWRQPKVTEVAGYNEGTANFAFAEPEREYGPAPFGRHSACTIC
jgi:hypothetical protein